MSPARKRQENLSGEAKILTVVLVVCLGLWGCARNPAGQAGGGERIRVLENRCQKLELDYRGVAQARDKVSQELAEETARLHRELADKANLVREHDQLRTQFKASLLTREALSRQLGLRTSERDDLRAQVAQRVSERDALANRCDKFRKGLQQLMTEDDNPVPPVPSISPSPSPSPAPSPSPTVSSSPPLGAQS